MNVVGICLLVAVIWGIAPIFEKMSLVKTSSFTALTVRITATAIVLLIITFLTGKGKNITSLDGRTVLFILVGGFFGILGLFLYFVALKQDAASRVVPLVNIFPLFTAGYSVLLLNEKLTSMRILGIILIVAGLFCINWNYFIDTHQE